MDAQLRQAITERLEIGRTRNAVLDELQAAGYSEAAATAAVNAVAAELTAGSDQEDNDRTGATTASPVESDEAGTSTPSSPPPYLREDTTANTTHVVNRLLLIGIFVLGAVALVVVLYFLEIDIRAPLEALPLPF